MKTLEIMFLAVRVEHGLWVTGFMIVMILFTLLILPWRRPKSQPVDRGDRQTLTASQMWILDQHVKALKKDGWETVRWYSSVVPAADQGYFCHGPIQLFHCEMKKENQQCLIK